MGFTRHIASAGLMALSTSFVAVNAGLAQPTVACAERPGVFALSESDVQRWVDRFEPFAELATALAADHAVPTRDGPLPTLRALASTEAFSNLDEASIENGFAGFCEWLWTADAVLQAYSILTANAADRGMMMVDTTVEENVNVVRPFETEVRAIVEER